MLQCPKDQIGIRIGQQIRRRRIVMGLSQRALGEAIGVTLQQVQKYESGVNSLTAARLFELARVQRVPVGYFLEEPDAGNMPSRSEMLGGAAAGDLTASERECLEFVKAFRRIKDAALCAKIRGVVRAIADSQAKP